MAIVFSVILRFCIVCHSSIYDFWLLFWYLVAIVLSFPPRFTTSDYPFGILWPLYFLSFLDLRLLISPLVSCDHCIVCHSSILYCLSFLDLRLLITPLVSFGHCVVCTSSIYDLWLSFWYLVAIVLSVRPRITTYDYPFGILWPLYCLSFFDLRLLVTPLISCGHCIVCPSSIYDFWLPFWYPVAIVLSVLPRFTTSDYPFGILWPLYCLSFPDLRLLITLLVSCGHCIVCPSSICDFWLPLWFLVAIVLSVVPGFTTYDYPFGILWPLYCLSFFDLRLLITLLVSCGHCIVCPSSIYDFWLPFWYLLAIVLSVLPRFTTSDYPFGILWPLYCLSFLDLRLLITPLVSFSHSIVCPSSIYDVWLPLWYLVAIVLSVIPRFCIVCHSSICDFWLSFWYLVAIVLSVIPRFCIVSHSSICDFWLPFWYLVAIALSVLPRSTTSDYPFGIIWPMYCLSFFDLRLMITPLVSCDHCIVCPSSIYDVWLPLWYLLAIVLSVLPRSTTSDYPFGIFWPLYCLSFLDLRLLITHLVSCGHCIVCPSSSYDFWLPFWYLVTIVLSVLPRFTTSDIPFGILWPLYFLSFLDLRLLITLLVSFSHCVVCPSSIYDFWLPFWYLRFTTSDYPFGILDLRLLITLLVSSNFSYSRMN